MVQDAHPLVHISPSSLRGTGHAPLGPPFAPHPSQHPLLIPAPCATSQPRGRTGPEGSRGRARGAGQGSGPDVPEHDAPLEAAGGGWQNPSPVFCPYHGRTLPSSGRLPAAAGQMRTATGGGEGHPGPPPAPAPVLPPHCWFLFLANWRTTLSYSVSPSHSLPCATKGCRSGTARLGTA